MLRSCLFRTALTFLVMLAAERVVLGDERADYPPEARERFDRGQQLQKQGKLQEAIDAYEEARQRGMSDYPLPDNFVVETKTGPGEAKNRQRHEEVHRDDSDIIGGEIIPRESLVNVQPSCHQEQGNGQDGDSEPVILVPNHGAEEGGDAHAQLKATKFQLELRMRGPADPGRRSLGPKTVPQETHQAPKPIAKCELVKKKDFDFGNAAELCSSRENMDCGQDQGRQVHDQKHGAQNLSQNRCGLRSPAGSSHQWNV